MKKILVVLAAVTLFTACKEETTNPDANVHITGNIKGFKKGTIYIQRQEDTTFVNIDTIKVDGDANFKSDIKLDTPDMLRLVLDRGTTESIDNTLRFFAEPGNINIDTRLDYFYSKAKITGSKNQDKMAEFENFNRRYTDTKLELLKRNLEATKTGNQTVLDSITKASDANLKRKYLFTANYALNNGKYEVTPYIVLSEIPDINTKYLDTIARAMTPQVAKSKYGKVLNEYLAERKKQEATPVK